MEPSVEKLGGTRVEDEDVLSLFDVASVLLRQRLLIVASVVLCTAYALLVALTTPMQYTSSASFLPHGGDGGGLGAAAGLAAQFGFAVPRSGSSERSPEFYQDLLQTREILDGVVDAGVEVQGDAGTRIVDLATHFEITEGTAEQRRAMTRRRLEAAISVAVGRGTGVVGIGVTTDDPHLSAGIVSRLLELVETFDVEARQSQASAERRFAEARLEELNDELTAAEDTLQSFLIRNRQFANSPELTFVHDRLQRRVATRQEVVTAMAQAYEQARIDEVRNTAIVTIINQPEVPALPNPRRRLSKLLLGVVLGLVLGGGLAFLRELGAREQQGRSEAYRGFERALGDVRRDPFGLRKSPDSASPGEPDA